jgi:hypothetical protein
MIARILDTGMAKKRISNVDLSWLISEALDAGKHQTRTALAVVPDEKDGWRVIISIRGRRYWTAARMSNVLLTSGRPLPSTSAWILLVKPPRDRPIDWRWFLLIQAPC